MAYIGNFSDGAIVPFGADGDVQLKHDADKGLIIKHTATADDKPVLLTLQTGETDMAANDILGAIQFQAVDEGTGTDAVLVAASIAAISEGDFSSSANATKLSFKTGASEAATEKMTLSSSGVLTLSATTASSDSNNGTLVVGGGLGVGGDISVEDDIFFKTDAAELVFGVDADVKLIHSADKGLILKSTATGNVPAILDIQTGDTNIGAGDSIGKITFTAGDEGEGTDAILAAGMIECVSIGDFAADDNAAELQFSTGKSAAAGSDGGLLALTPDGELRLKALGTADNRAPSFKFQAGDNDIAADDSLGKIEFQAPDEGAGTDAILVAAAIEALSEGDFANDNNATKLVFKTGASEAAASSVEISSAGNLSLIKSNTELRFYEGTNYVGFEAPALTGDQIWVLPASDSSGTEYLRSDGSGNLSFGSPAAGVSVTSYGDEAKTLAAGANLSDNTTLTTGRTLTLPASPSAGDVFHIKAPMNLGGNVLTIARGHSSQKIDNVAGNYTGLSGGSAITLIARTSGNSAEFSIV